MREHVEDDFAAHVNKMERDRQAQQAELARYKERTRQKRAEAAGWTGGLLAVSAGVVGVCWIIWQASAGPSDEQLLMQEDRQQCVEHGGTYTFVNGSEDLFSCTMPGVSTK